MVERYPGRYYTSVLFIDIHDRETDNEMSY